MILVPENEFSHLKGVSKQPYLDIRTVPNISLCNRFSEVLWYNRSARMHSWFLVSPTFCFWLWTTMFVFEPFVMVWNNKGPNVSSNNPSEQEPLHHIWPRDFWFPVFHSSLYTPLRFLHPSNSPFPSILPGSKQVWLRNHLYDFHLQIHFTVIKLSFAQRLVLKPRHKETFIHELLTGAFDRTNNNWNVALRYTEFWRKYCCRIYINNCKLYFDWT